MYQIRSSILCPTSSTGLPSTVGHVTTCSVKTHLALHARLYGGPSVCMSSNTSMEDGYTLGVRSDSSLTIWSAVAKTAPISLIARSVSIPSPVRIVPLATASVSGPLSVSAANRSSVSRAQVKYSTTRLASVCALTGAGRMKQEIAWESEQMHAHRLLQYRVYRTVASLSQRLL